MKLDSIINTIGTEYDIVKYPSLIQGVMGIDPGWGTSNFGIVITYFVDGLIRVAYVDQYSRSDHSEMVFCCLGLDTAVQCH